MNPTLATALLRQRLTSPMRLIMLSFLFLSSLGVVAATKQLGALEASPALFALVLAAGAIGQEISSGVLTLTFARPVTRAAYVFSRWLGAGGFAAALGLVQIALGLMAIGARGGPAPPAGDLAALVLECVIVSLAASAVMVMLSSLVNGLGDVGLWALFSVVASMTGMLAQLKNWTVLARAVTELQGVLLPSVHLGWVFGRGDPGWFELVSVLSTMTAALAVAACFVNRKELSYAAG